MKYEDDKLCIEIYEKMAQAYYSQLNDKTNLTNKPNENNIDFSCLINILSITNCLNIALKNYFKSNRNVHNEIESNIKTLTEILFKNKEPKLEYIKINLHYNTCKKRLIIKHVELIGEVVKLSKLNGIKCANLTSAFECIYKNLILLLN